MSLSLLFALLAIACFAAAALGYDSGKGVPLGLIFFVIMVAFT